MIKEKVKELINKITITEVSIDGEHQYSKLCEMSVDAYAQLIIDTVNETNFDK